MTLKKFDVGIIHIGLGKTGTSSIQANLLKNADVLEKMNIHFPIINNDPRPFNGNHSVIMTSLFSDRAVFLPDNINVGFNTTKKINNSNENILKEIYDGFSRTKAEKLIISAEAATHFDNQTISKMSTWLKNHCNKIIIIACLRHPEDALASEIQQQIKIGKTLEELYCSPPISPISGCIQRHINFYGHDNVNVYDFFEAMQHIYGLFGAFLEKINLNPEDFDISNEYRNKSLSQEAVVLLSTLNKVRPLRLNNQIGAKRFLRDRELFFSLPGKKYRIPKHVLDASKEIINTEIEWVQEKFGLKLDKRNNNLVQLENEFSQEALESLVISVSDLQNKLEYHRLMNIVSKKVEKKDLLKIEQLKSEAERLLSS